VLPTETTAQNANHSITSRAGPGSDRVRIVSANAILDLVPRGPPCGVVPDAAGMSRYQRICDVDVSAFVFERDVHRGDK